MEYRVTWIIDIEAESPEDAARKAQAIQQDKDSIATVFHVTQNGAALTDVVDLGEVTE